MTVLVTGASGFIGRLVVTQLAAKGLDVLAAHRNGAEGQWPDGVRGVSLDVLDSQATARFIAETKPSHLVHLAWYVEPGRFWSSPLNLDWTAASLMLLKHFLDAGGARAVMAGTCAEYDWTVGSGRLSEDAPVKPSTFYGATKNSLWLASKAAGDLYGVPVAWGRQFWLYGPGETSGRLVSDVSRSLVLGEEVEVGEGLQRRDFIHVDDVAGAFVAALLSDYAGVFNVGSGSAGPVRDIVRRLAEISGRPDLIRWGAKPTAANEPALIEADITTLTSRIGFSPAISLDDGLASTYQFWRDRQARDEPGWK